jgi:energy-coupling factor transporter ATP-binding protein EcfA2
VLQRRPAGTRRTGRGTITLTGVSKPFDGKRSVTALEGVDVSIARGEMGSIVGPSGSGKSTLLNLIGTLDRPTEGWIAIDGQERDVLDVVAARFTPSRMPLIDQRWSGLPADVRVLPLLDEGSDLPHSPQLGARWNHVGSGFEFSLSAFRGHNSQPLFATAVPAIASLPSGAGAFQGAVPFVRVYPCMWTVGGDAAVPLKWATIKAEAALRQNGDGSWTRLEYPQASGQHVRFTAEGTLIRGAKTDFFGRSRRNSNITVTVRYSF